MLYIPPELYIDIVGSLTTDPSFDWATGALSPQAALKSLALTSQPLRVLAQPPLFETITIPSLPDSLSLSRLVTLKQLFDGRPEITSWVKKFRLRRLPSGRGPIPANTPTLQQLWLTLSEIFVRMDKLQIVNFEWVRVSEAMHEHIRYGLPNLRSLIFKSVTIEYFDDFENLPAEELPLEALHISGYRGQRVPTAVARLARAPNLDYLALPYLNPTTLRSLIGPTLPHVFKNLSRLFILDSPSFEHLALFAAQCPNLRSLHFLHPSDALEARNGVPSDMLPSLTRYRGPLDVAQLLVPGRPLEAIDVSTYISDPREWSRGDLEPLARGLANVRGLILGTFSWYKDFMYDLRDLFPHAEMLKLAFHKPDKASGHTKAV